MTVYLQELKGMFDALAAIGSPLSQKDMIVQALNGLPVGWVWGFHHHYYKQAVRSFDDLKTK